MGRRFRARLGPAALPYGALALAAGCQALFGLDALTYDARPASGSGGASASAGSGGAPAAASQSGSATASGTGSGSGAGGAKLECIKDGDCTDGNPCTVDACGAAGQCAHAAVAVGGKGTGEAPCEGTCQTDGACGLSLYERQWNSLQAFKRTALSLAWTGPYAPPPRGIVAADHAYGSERLYVFGTQGKGTTYVRVDGAWQAPTATVLLFPKLDPLAINSAVMYRATAAGPETLGISTKGPGTSKLAYIYYVNDAGAVTPEGGNPFVIPKEPDVSAAPQESVDCDWELVDQSAYTGTPSWVLFWRSYQGSVYRWDGGDFTWTKQGPDVMSKVWGPLPATGPAAAATRAAYLHSGVLSLIAP